MSDDSQYWPNSDVVSTKMISVSRRVQIHRDTLTKLKFEKCFFYHSPTRGTGILQRAKYFTLALSQLFFCGRHESAPMIFVCVAGAPSKFPRLSTIQNHPRPLSLKLSARYKIISQQKMNTNIRRGHRHIGRQRNSTTSLRTPVPSLQIADGWDPRWPSLRAQR